MKKERKQQQQQDVDTAANNPERRQGEIRLRYEGRSTDQKSEWEERIHLLYHSTKRSNQSILKEINPEYSLEGLMLKLKIQYFGHLIRRADSLEKTLMLGKIEGRRRRGRQRMRWLDGWHHQPDGHEFEQTLGDSKGQGSLVCCSLWGCKESDMT